METVEKSLVAAKALESRVSVGSKVLGILLAAENSMYEDVLDLVLETFASEFGFFGYIDDDTGALVCPSMTRHIFHACQVTNKSIVFPRSVWGGLWGRILLEKTSLYKNEIHRTPEGHLPLYRSLGSPIIYQGKLIGSIHVANRATNYGSEDVELMESITSIIAPVLSARLQRDREDAKRRAAEEALAEHMRELAESNARLAELNQKLQEQVEEGRNAQAIIREQTQQLRELSTPVVQIWDNVLVAPLVGALDSSRMHQFMARLLELIVSSGAAIALIDITGLPTVDTQTAQYLFNTTAAVRLLGAQVVLTGVRPSLAQTIVSLDIDLSSIVTRSSLASGLQYAFDALRLRVVPCDTTR